MKTRILQSYLAPLAALLYNLLLAYIVYAIARTAYLLDNWSYFAQGLSLEMVHNIFLTVTADDAL